MSPKTINNNAALTVALWVLEQQHSVQAKVFISDCDSLLMVHCI